ncbi:MAG: DUF5916 domain-containing protein [Pseudomonadales bacterium]|jgi:hypothetical protein|nr:DUF5916 domain-containing protein [Pseudomonadales bacterium]HJN49869.1 DUF5916 domain-containing protein [Pseudomonadales bacterium]
MGLLNTKNELNEDWLLPLLYRGIGLILLLTYGVSAHAAGSDVRTIKVTNITDRITVDGILDEAIWRSAPPIGELIQRLPNPGARPTERTQVTLLRDANNLYVGVVVYDSDPDKLTATNMARDASLGSQDRLEILLDTYRDQRNAFYFATNPVGALVDGLAFGNRGLNTNWDAIWNLRTQRTNEGWTAEIAIPFKSLSFPADESVWGFNISRNIYRKQEENRWSGARLETSFLQVSEAGKITNMSDLNQGIGLDVRPFAASSWLHSKGVADDDSDLEPGLDVSYNITPSLKLTGTVNTDFGETEVDARQINLTRFSLFFPEKRSFFLEDVGVFNFASTGPQPPGGIPGAGADVFPIFSRRIGLLGGQEVPIDVGAKLTGKVGSTDIGFLGVRTDYTSFVEGKNFFVGRFKQNLLEQSYVGGVFTHGDPASGASGRTYGLDTSLATSRFLGKQRNFIFNAYALKSDNDGVFGDDLSFGFSARYPNDKWDGMLVFREIQENFNPRVGFVQRNNVRMIRVAGSYNPRPKDFLNIQQMSHDIYYTAFERLDNGLLESSELYIAPLDWHFRSGDSLHAFGDFVFNFERLFEPFEISPGVVLAPGKYRNTRNKIIFTSASKRRLSGLFFLTFGDFWSGSAKQVTTSITYRMPPWITVSLRANQTFADLPEGNFIARILTSTVNFPCHHACRFRISSSMTTDRKISAGKVAYAGPYALATTCFSPSIRVGSTTKTAACGSPTRTPRCPRSSSIRFGSDSA